MEITWHGETCFTIKGKSGTVVFDPYKSTTHKPSGLKGDIILYSQGTENALPVAGETKSFDWPGEYEVKEIPIIGASSEDGKTMFKIIVDGIKLCHLGRINSKVSSEMLESLGDIDILFIPVGGDGTLDAKKAHEIIESIEPRAVIPMQYDDVEPFTRQVGGVKPQETEKFTATSLSNFPEDRLEVIILKPV